MTRHAAFFLLLFVPSLVGLAIQVPDSQSTLETAAALNPPPPSLWLGELSAVKQELPAAAVAVPHRLQQIATWNRAGKTPQQNGFSRQLALAPQLLLGADTLLLQNQLYGGGLFQASAAGELVWATRIDVADSHRVRLGLSTLNLPLSTRLWVYNSDGSESVAFSPALLGPDGVLWTPSVQGPTVHLQLRIPHDAVSALGTEGAHVVVDSVLELFQLDSTGAPLPTGTQPQTECLQDARCQTTATYDKIDVLRGSTAHLQFVVGSSGFICTGQLLADTVSSTSIPYLLTANHCFSSQSSASSLESYFDFIANTCNGAFPPLSSAVRVNGSSLLDSSTTSDFSFVRLNSTPPSGPFGRWWNGWTTATPANNSTLYRVHHPNGWPQSYSETRFLASPSPSLTCQGAPTSSFHYQQRSFGGTFGGSSGAVVRGASGVVGQLFGLCGTNLSDGCDGVNNRWIDGRFNLTYNRIDNWLDPATGPTVCVADDATLCLRDDRFQVEVDYMFFDGSTGDAMVATPKTDDSGLFYFVNPDNWEILIKVLDGCSFNDNFWVFFAATTNVEFTVTVTDTNNGQSKSYTNPLGNPANAITDTVAFATCP